VEFQSGITVQNLNEQLLSMGLAIKNMGGFDGQTWAGVMSTSTHGSGIHLGPLVDSVRSLVLITTNKLDSDKREGSVFIYRIESASSPMTNPKVYKNSKIKLIQNNDIFYSVIVSMGTMGIIYSTVIEVRSKFYIYERRYTSNWEELIKDNKMGELLHAHPHVEFMVSSYPKETGLHSSLVTVRDECPPDQKCEKPFNTQFGRCLLKIISNLIIAEQTAGLTLHPHHFVGFNEQSITALTGEYVDLSYKVFHLGDLSGRLGYGIEFMVPLEGGSIENLITVMNEIFKFAEENRLAERYSSTPLGIRFVRGSPAYLSMMHGSDLWATIEVDMQLHTEGGTGFLQRLQRRLYHKFRGHKLVRFHWGLDMENFGRNYLTHMYPYYPKWEAVYKQFNRDHIFDNPWTLRMGLDRTGEEEMAEKANLLCSGELYSEDSGVGVPSRAGEKAVEMLSYSTSDD
jgi:hypothetical protein